MRSLGAGRAPRAGAAGVVAVAVLCSATMAFAEGGGDAGGAGPAERREPLIGVYLQPIFSSTLPTGSSGPVVDVYGSIQPTGAVGVTVHPTRRFTLGFDLEVQAWEGALPAVDMSARGEADIGAIPISFLNYWIHLRGRTMIVTAGRFQLHIDAVVGLAVGREDAERFRAEGLGAALGLGPVATVSLGDYVALSFSAILEGGWIFYDVESPQAAAGESYMLTWPRVLIGVGLHGFLAHRRTRHAARGEAAPTPAEQAPAPVEPAASPAPQPETPPAAEEPMPPPW
jgi:hypothetical protein